MMLHFPDNDDEHEWDEVVNVDRSGCGWGDGLRNATGNGWGGWATKLSPKADLYQAAWESPTGVSQLYLLSAMVSGDTLNPNVQELTNGPMALNKEKDDEREENP